jgi:acyl dehydratase
VKHEGKKIQFPDFKPGFVLELDPVALTEKEIIEFAKRFDPLDFHIDVEAAKRSFFKGLIASGPHLFNAIYQKYFLPYFKDTIICGLEMNNWKFIKPIYANFPVKTIITVTDIQPNHEKGVAVVKWNFDFLSSDGEQVQRLDMTLLHKMK